MEAEAKVAFAHHWVLMPITKPGPELALGKYFLNKQIDVHNEIS